MERWRVLGLRRRIGDGVRSLVFGVPECVLGKKKLERIGWTAWISWFVALIELDLGDMS